MIINKEDAYIESIYKKAMIARSQREKEVELLKKKEYEDSFWKYLYTRLDNLLKAIYHIDMTMPDISKQEKDKMKKDVSELIHLVNTNTLPEVINQLTIDLVKKNMLDKIKKEDNISQIHGN